VTRAVSVGLLASVVSVATLALAGTPAGATPPRLHAYQVGTGTNAPHLLVPSTTTPMKHPKGDGQTGPKTDTGPDPAFNLTNPQNNEVMTHPNIELVFWLPPGEHYEAAGTAAADTNYEHLIERFFDDAPGTPYENILSQYAGNNGAPDGFTSSFYVDDETPYPEAGTEADPLTNAAIQAEVLNVANTVQIPATIAELYMVFTAQGMLECGQPNDTDCDFPDPTTGDFTNFCAYHSSFPTNQGNAIYAYMPDPENDLGCGVGGPNNDPLADNEISLASHEAAESITDPEITSWQSYNNPGLGQEDEVADLCEVIARPEGAGGTDVFLNGDPYNIQPLWSNAASNCGYGYCPTSANGVDCSTMDASMLGALSAVDGTTFEQTVTITNPSDTEAAVDPTFNDTLPPGEQYVEYSGTNGIVGTNSTVTWIPPPSVIPVHQSITLTFEVQLDANAPAPGTSIENCGTFTYLDWQELANQAPITTCVDTAVQIPTTTSVVDQGPDAFGQPDTLVATVSPSDGGGEVAFSDTGSGTTIAGCANVSLSVVDNQQQATCVTNRLPIGGDTITASYNGDTDYGASTSSPLAVDTGPGPSNISLTGTPNPSTANQPVTLTATVASDGRGAVTFNYLDDTTWQPVCVSVPLVANQAQCVVSNLSVGENPYQAVYTGDTSYQPSTAETTLDAQESTTTSLTSNSNPAVYGDNVTFTATVSVPGADGNVTFDDNGAPISGCSQVSTQFSTYGATATCTTSFLPLGNSTVEANYSGSDGYQASNNSMTQSVQEPSLTTVTANPNPAGAGSFVTLQSTVDASDTGGTVSFFLANNSTLTAINSSCTADPVTSTGTTQCVTDTLPVGSDTIAAVYSGDTDNQTSTGTTVAVVTTLDPTTTVLTPSENPAPEGLGVTFTATVSGSDGGGTVSLYNGVGDDPMEGCADLTLNSSGQVSCTVKFETIRTLPISAFYSGDNVAAPSSGTLSEKITAPLTSILVLSSPTATSTNRGIIYTDSAKLISRAGKGIGGQTLKFYLGSTQICTALTNLFGAAKCSGTVTLAQLQQKTYGVSFAGGGGYAASYARARRTVPPPP
jgi:hypothetical protein